MENDMKKHLMRNTEKGIIAGVCAGLGDYFNISPWIFRAIFVLPVLPFVLNFASGVLSIVVYILLAIFMPSKQRLEEGEVVEVDYEIVDDDEDSDQENEEADKEEDTDQDEEADDGVKDFSDDGKENGNR